MKELKNMLLHTTISLFLLATCCLEATANVCYGDLGCYSLIGEFIDVIYRPYNVHPEHPSKIATEFSLFTPNNSSEAQIISRYNKSTIINSNFNPDLNTTIICFGYTDHISVWMLKTKDLIIERFRRNVILVDWSKGNKSPYSQASANARVVGREIGNLLVALQEIYHIDYHSIHFIGHSLGAHIGGYASQWLNTSIFGRITGLDPAGMGFFNMHPNVRLDPSDALLVDCIHSSGSELFFSGLGTLQPMGHVDFYPDGGKKLKSCYFDDALEFIRENGTGNTSNHRWILTCSHTRSRELFTQSIAGECPFTSYACSGIDSYKDAECYTCDSPGHDCLSMGYHVTHYPLDGLHNAKYFLTTYDRQDFYCAFHWVVEIGILASNSSELTGDFYLAVDGTNEGLDFTKLYNSKLTEISSGTNRYMIEFPQNPLPILSIDFSWEFISGDDGPIDITYIKLIPIDFIDQSKRKSNTVEFCSDSLQNLTSGKRINLLPTENCS